MKAQYDVVTAIMEYEQGDLSYDESIELFQHLFDTGLINGLQGSYGRTMARLINDGLIETRKRKAA